MIEEPKLYHWYSAKAKYRDNIAIGQCMGADQLHVALRHFNGDMWRETRQFPRNAVLSEINDPRYLIRLAKWFAVTFFSLEFRRV